MCKEAEKFTFLLLPTFDTKNFLLVAVFCYQTRTSFKFGFCVVATLIVKIASQLGDTETGGSEFNFLLISVYECHHYDSTHICSRPTNISISLSERSRLFDFVTPSIRVLNLPKTIVIGFTAICFFDFFAGMAGRKKSNAMTKHEVMTFIPRTDV